jgi:hypothetical protein
MRERLGVLLAGVVACGGSDPPEGRGACPGITVLAAMSDYGSSAVGGFGPTGETTLAVGVNLGRDPVLTVSHGRAFFLARDQETVFGIDGCGVPVTQMGVHRGTVGSSNPQDVGVGPDGTLWIPRFNPPTLTIYDGQGAALQDLDLSPYDGDGNPQASAIHMIDLPEGPKAFVTLERLDDADPFLRSKQPSWLLRIDVASRTVEGHVELAGRNPFSATRFGGALFLAEPGNFDAVGEPFAGIERFDTATSSSVLLVPETALGGSVNSVAVTEGCGAAIVADPTPTVNATSLVTFDPASGTVHHAAADPILATPGYDLQGLTWVDRVLYVGDRRRAERGYPVHAFERMDEGCTLRALPDTVFLAQKPVALQSGEGIARP